MSTAKDSEGSAAAQSGWFTTTHWSLVLHAREPSSPQAAEALEKLCRAYWYPLYVYVRQQGEDEESAKDLTQAFFARLLEKNYLAQAHRDKGKFRSFLLGSLKHFLCNEWEKARTQKRGGGVKVISLDETTIGEARFHQEPVDSMNAEKLFERRWALTVLEQARARLETEYSESGKARLYDRLKVLQSGDCHTPAYAEVAAELGLTESAVKSAVFRLRQRYQELIRAEVANTVNHPAEVDEEIRYLISVISG